MSSGTPSPIDAYSPVNAASPIIAASPVSTTSLSISITSPVGRKSPVRTTTSHTISPVHATAHVTSTSPPIHTASPAHIASPINSISPPDVVESPESHSSTFSTVYSPAELLNSSGANIDAECCRNGIKVRRQRLRPWLINQINSGEIPGLVWLDKENMIFKIPWKHFGRPGVDMYMDALLFRRWALHTKKFEQGRPSDISTWKTRFRCALHKLPDIEELNDQNQTEGDEPYRVYKFRKIELETVPAGIPHDDEPESSIGSVGSPVSTPYQVENINMSSGVDTYRAPVTTVYSSHIGRNNEHLPHKTGVVFPKQEVIDKYVGYTSPTPRKRHPHKLGGMPATDIQKWQYYDHIRIREAYPDEKSNIASSDDCGYDAEDEVGRKMSAVPKSQNTKEEHKYQGMDYETDDDDSSWNSRGCVQINQPIQSVPSIVSRYPIHYSDSNGSSKQRAFEPYERRYSTESTSEVGVIKNLKTVTAKRTTPTDKDGMYDEQDDNDLFFQSCAKRIKKLDTKSSGYLKLKILEHFYYVENFQQNQSSYYNQSYRYRTDPPPLISNANVRTTEQVIDVDDSMQGVK